MRKHTLWWRRGAWGAAALFAVLIAGPPIARAQSVEERIQMLEKQLEALKKELAAQKEKVEKQEKATAPLADMKKTVDALSKIEITGGATGIVQSTSGAPRSLGQDESFAGGSFDLIVTYKPMDNVKLVIDMEAIGGNGPDSRFPTFSVLNRDLGTTNDTVTVLEAYLEATFFKERLTLTAGKIDLTSYVDKNAYANSETFDFLTKAFTNNAVLSNPANGPGMRGRFDIMPGLLYAEAGAQNGDRDGDVLTTNKFFEDVYGVAEIGITPKIFGRQGNYRLWAFADGAARKSNELGQTRRFTAYGTGVSFDQELADWLGAFFRLGYRDPDNTNFNTQAAWMAGVQLSKIIPGRKDDVIGIAYGEIHPTKRAVTARPVRDEEVYELYYRWHFADKFHLSPIIQRVEDRQGVTGNDALWVFGTRLQVDF